MNYCFPGGPIGDKTQFLKLLQRTRGSAKSIKHHQDLLLEVHKKEQNLLIKEYTNHVNSLAR